MTGPRSEPTCALPEQVFESLKTNSSGANPTMSWSAQYCNPSSLAGLTGSAHPAP